MDVDFMTLESGIWYFCVAVIASDLALLFVSEEQCFFIPLWDLLRQYEMNVMSLCRAKSLAKLDLISKVFLQHRLHSVVSAQSSVLVSCMWKVFRI